MVGKPKIDKAHSCPACDAAKDSRAKPLGDITAMTDEELRQGYNRLDKPNAYGEELLRRIHARDREALGMSADNERLR